MPIHLLLLMASQVSGPAVDGGGGTSTSTVFDAVLAPVVVTASRDKRSAFELDRTVHVIGQAAMHERQAQEIPGALEETTGVLVQRTNRGAGAPILRGMIGPSNLLVFDGIRLNNSTYRTGPNQYLALIDPVYVERLEAMLGPGSVLYGSDAMGGVVQALPFERWPRAGWGARGGTRFVSHDTSTTVWLGGGYGSDEVEASLGGAFRNFGTLVSGGGSEQVNSDFLQGAWHAHGAYRLGANTSVAATYLGARVRDAGRVDQLYNGSFRFYDNDDDLWYLDFKHAKLGPVRELRLALSLHRTREDVDRFRCALGPDPTPADAFRCTSAADVVRQGAVLPRAPLTREELYLDEVWTPGVLAHATLEMLDQRLRIGVGADGYFDAVGSKKSERRDRDSWAVKDLDRGNFSDGSTYRTMGAFAIAEADVLKLEGHRVTLTGGARVASFAAHAEGVPSLGVVEYDSMGIVATGGVRYELGKKISLYGNFSQGFRAPNLQESTVLGDTGSKFEIPNGDLEPEKSNSVEVGTKLAWGPLSLQLAGFYNLLSKLIDEKTLTDEELQTTLPALGLAPEDTGGKPVVQRVNASSGKYFGAELTAAVGPVSGITPWVRLSYIRGEVESQDGAVYPARRVPPFLGVAGLRFSLPRTFYAELFSRFAATQARLHPSDLDDLRICGDPERLGSTFGDSGRSCPGTEGWVTFNVRGGYEIDEGFRVDLAFLNILDEAYREHGSGIPAPGRGVALSLAGEY